MKYAQPNNLMLRRNERSEVIKGGIVFGVICLIIIGLFSQSNFAKQSYDYEGVIICKGLDKSSCFFK